MSADIKMVDVSQKSATQREAVAKAEIVLGMDVVGLIKSGRLPKGDVLAAAKIAGIQAAKKTQELIPLCHPIKLSFVEIDFKLLSNRVLVESRVKAQDVTGVEMEALTACAISALTIYDMCKQIRKDIYIENIRLVKKSGGKSGVWIAK